MKRKVAPRKAPGSRAARARTKGVVVPPNSTLQLMDSLGVTGAARRLGTTPGTLHKARRAGQISQVIEVAAAGVMRELGGAQEAPRQPLSDNASVTFLLTTTRSKENAVRSFAQAIDAILVST